MVPSFTPYPTSTACRSTFGAGLPWIPGSKAACSGDSAPAGVEVAAVTVSAGPTAVAPTGSGVLVGAGVSDPTRGYHSPTQSRKGVAADQTFHDGVADILFNRRQFSDFDQLVTEWRTNAGDAIRKELLDEIAASK